MPLRNCGTCDYLRRTSPEQVFLLCEFWSAEYCPADGDVFGRFGHDYVITHCHMQPEAPACPFWVQEGQSRIVAKTLPNDISARDERKARALTGNKTTDALNRYSADLYAEFTRMTVKQLRTYANQNHVPLGGESTKAGIIQEMVGQLRHRKLVELAGDA